MSDPGGSRLQWDWAQGAGSPGERQPPTPGSRWERQPPGAPGGDAGLAGAGQGPSRHKGWRVF